MTIKPKKAIRKGYSPEEKAQIVLEILNEEQTLAQILASVGVHVNQLERLPSVFTDEAQAVRATEAAQEQERQALYAEIGRLTTQLAWLKKKPGLDPAQGGPGRLG